MFRMSDIVKNNSLHEEIALKLKIVTSHPVDHFGTRCTPISVKIMFRMSDIVKNNSLHEEFAQKLKMVTSHPVDHFGTRCTPISVKIMFRMSDIVKNNSLHEEIDHKLKIVTSHPVDHFRYEMHPHKCQNHVQNVRYSQKQLATRGNRSKVENSDVTSG
jgi:hypothetical protein